MGKKRSFTWRKKRAGDETRTRDIFLGKEVLYQLSYTREADGKYEKAKASCQSPSLIPSLSLCGRRGDPVALGPSAVRRLGSLLVSDGFVAMQPVSGLRSPTSGCLLIF
jgi:hypothetical protein